MKWNELDVAEFALWPRLAQGVSLCLLLLIMQGISYIWFLTPPLNELVALKQQEQQLKAVLTGVYQKYAGFAGVEQQVVQLEQQNQLFTPRIPSRKQLPLLLKAISQSGQQQNLSFTRIEWGEEQPEPFLIRLPLHIELQGSFENIGAFTQAIAELPHIITLDSLIWKSAKDGVVLTLQASTYLRLSEVADAD